MKRWMIVITLIILVIPFILADLDSGISCSTSANCSLCETNSQTQCYCFFQTASCWINTSYTGPAPSGNILPPSNQNTTTDIAAGLANFNGVGSTTDLNSLQLALSLLQQQVTASETRNQQQVNALQESLSSLQQQVSQLSIQVQSLSLQGDQVGGIRTEISTVSSGLAALQHNLDLTKSELSGIENNLNKEQKRTRLISGFLLSIIVLAAAATAVYFISNKRRRINHQILTYITDHIKKGIKYSDIKASLERAGWDAEDIDWAYQSTTKHNHKKDYLKNHLGSSQEFDTKKIAGISIVSILIIISVIFLLKGITTGQAIHFQTEEELSRNVLQELQTRIATNQFYPLVQSALLCVEVKDGLKSVSFRILKTAAGHSIDPARKSCSDDNNYNAAVKFTSWDNFAHLMNDFTCRTARELHTNNRDGRGVYVLPSQLVLPGFRKNQQVDYTSFCSLLRSCLTETELAVLGC